MIRHHLKGTRLLALAFGFVLAGAAFAGEGCKHGAQATAKAGDETNEHCLYGLMKNVSKEAQLTSDGAIITLKAKNADAVKALKAHLEAHSKGEGCPDCPLCPASLKDVATKVKVTSDGGTITVTARTPEAIKAVQDWVKSPDNGCTLKAGQKV